MAAERTNLKKCNKLKDSLARPLKATSVTVISELRRGYLPDLARSRDGDGPFEVKFTLHRITLHRIEANFFQFSKQNLREFDFHHIIINALKTKFT